MHFPFLRILRDEKPQGSDKSANARNEKRRKAVHPQIPYTTSQTSKEKR
jgi:hypothetical protein